MSALLLLLAASPWSATDPLTPEEKLAIIERHAEDVARFEREHIERAARLRAKGDARGAALVFRRAKARARAWKRKVRSEGLPMPILEMRDGSIGMLDRVFTVSQLVDIDGDGEDEIITAAVAPTYSFRSSTRDGTGRRVRVMTRAGEPACILSGMPTGGLRDGSSVHVTVVCRCSIGSAVGLLGDRKTMLVIEPVLMGRDAADKTEFLKEFLREVARDPDTPWPFEKEKSR